MFLIEEKYKTRMLIINKNWLRCGLCKKQVFSMQSQEQVRG